MAAGTPGTISNLTPALAHAAASAAAAVQQRVAADQPDRELAILRGLDQHPGRRRGIGGLSQAGLRAHVTAGDGRQVRGGDDQVRLAEQLGRPHRQQPLVARARARQRDPSG